MYIFTLAVEWDNISEGGWCGERMVGGRINSTPNKHIVELLGLGPGPGPRLGVACLGGGGYSS